MRGEQPAADPKKVDGANCVALRTPIRPLRTGKVACDQNKIIVQIDVQDSAEDGSKLKVKIIDAW